MTQPSSSITLVITTAMQAMASMALFTVPVMAPVIAPALRVPTAWVGGFVALGYLGAMLSSMVAGALVPRRGALRVSQVGLLLSAAGLLLCALPVWPAAALGALLVGSGYGPITPASSHLLASTTPPHRMSLVFSVKQTGTPLGGMLAGALVPGALLLIGWQATLVAVGLACLVCVPLAQPLRSALDADRQFGQPLALAALFRPLHLVLGRRALMTLAVCSFLFAVVQSSVVTYLVTYLHDDLGMTLLAAGAAVSVGQLGGAAGRIAWGVVADRGLGPRNTLMLLACLIVAGSMLAAALQGHWPMALLLAVAALLGCAGIGWNGVYLAEVARQAPPGRIGMATGGTLLFTYMGVTFGAPAFGALTSISGSYRLPFAALALPAVVALALLGWQTALEKRETARAAKLDGSAM